MPSPRALARGSPASISSRASASLPRHAASITRRELQRCQAGRVDDRVGLLDQRRSGVERSRMNVEARAIGGRDREHAERARLARDAQRARRQLVPQLVVPQVLGQAARQPEPAHVACRQSLLAAERAERLPQRRHAGRVALGEPRRQAVEEQVDRARRLRRRRRSPSGLGGLADARLAAEAAGVHRRRRSPRDGSREPSRRRAVRGAGRHRATARGASLPRVRANTISARSRSSRAR